MTFPWPEIVITLLLAAGFAAVGECVLWRFSENVFSWNESFLVGAGTSAAVLFPLSVLWRNGALRATLGLLGVAILFAAARRFRRKPDSLPAGRSQRPRTDGDPVAVALTASIVIVGVLFAALNFRYSYLWDGFQIWASKAQILYYRGGLGSEWYPGVTEKPLALNYPALVPLYEALICVVRRGFDFDVLKPVFAVFYASMLLSTFAAARAILPRRLALAATLLLALLPAVSTGLSAGGYADMPQAAFVAGVMAAAWEPSKSRRVWLRPFPWLVGSLTTVKSEGLILAIIACLGTALFWRLEGPHRFLARCRREATGAMVVGAFLILRLGYLRWVSVPDLVYGPIDSAHLLRAVTLLRADAALCARALLDVREWALLWPAFFLASAYLLVRGAPRERCLALATATGVVVYAGVFLFSNWPPAMHIPNAYPRLLVHLAPAASVTILLGYERARSSAPVSVP